MEKLAAYLSQPRWQKRKGDFARECGISNTYLSDLLAGRNNPSMAVAARIASATKGRVPLSAWVDGAKSGAA